MDRWTQDQDIIAAIISVVHDERERAEKYNHLMYDNPGKYTRLYKQPIPCGYEDDVKQLKKARDAHKKTADKLWQMIGQDGYGKPYYLIK